MNNGAKLITNGTTPFLWVSQTLTKEKNWGGNVGAQKPMTKGKP